MKSFFTHKRTLATLLMIAGFVVAQIAHAQMTTGTVPQSTGMQILTTGLQQQGTGGTTGAVGTTGLAPAPTGTGSAILTGGPQLSICSPTEFNVHGWIWSSDIGWTSLNCADSGGHIHFGVNQDSTTGTWTGWAWSENLGWLKFGNGIGAPAAGYVKATGAGSFEVQKVPGTATFDRLVGYARYCVLASSPTGCSGTAGSNTGGADGYLSLSGFNDQNSALAGVQTTANYGVTIAKTATNGQYPISGYAWGGQDVGWAHFEDAYVDSTQVNTAHITLTANPTSVAPSGTTALTYTITAAEAQYFDGSQCTAAATPTATGWSGLVPGVSATNLIRTVSGVGVPGNPTNYTITCPVVNTGSSQTTAVATTVVAQVTPGIGLTAQSHDLCVAGSANSSQSTTIGWTLPASAFSYCRLYSDGVAGPQIAAATGSAAVGPFSTPTSNPYSTPASSGNPHEYYLRCYDASNTQLAESNHEFVGVAPNTFNGTTANGALNCAQQTWGITMTGTNTMICSTRSATLSWSSWGTVPNAYTYAKLKVTNGGITTTLPTAYRLSDTATISLPGTYTVYYYTTGATASAVSGGPVVVTAGSCGNTYNGPSSFGPLCPAGSANTQNAVPKSFPWSADSSATCTVSTNGGQQIPTNASSGSISVSGAKTVIFSCTWPDGTSTSTNASYGPMLAATDPFCTTPPATTGVPIIKER